MPKITRRTFVKSAAAAGAAFPLFTIAGTKSSGKVLGANETIRVGDPDDRALDKALGADRGSDFMERFNAAYGNTFEDKKKKTN